MYNSYYGLRAKPFQLSPDPRFFYSSDVHKRAMAYLRYGLMQEEGFIVVTGDIGTGKTMLVRNLFSEMSKEDVVAAQLVTTQLEADDTLRMVAASFGINHEGMNKAALLKMLEMSFMAAVKEGRRVLLVVDEAQNLPPRSLEELRMLSNYQYGGRSLMQCFLLGQQEFRGIIGAAGMEQLRQRVLAAYHLHPLDARETQAYIEHRLSFAGWHGDPKISSGAYHKIYQNTGGIPRRINTFCDRALLFGYLEGLHEIDEGTVMQVVDELTLEGGRPSGAGHDASAGKAAGDASDIGRRISAIEEKLYSMETSVDVMCARLAKAFDVKTG